MKKIFKSLLVVVMILFVVAPSVYAKNDNSKKLLVALGDSITWGVGLEDEYMNPSEETYPYLLAGMLELELDEGKNYEVRNLAIPGWNSTDLLNALKYDETYINSVKYADTIVLNIGSNDFLGGFIDFALTNPGNVDLSMLEEVIYSGLNSVENNLNEILALVYSYNKHADIIVYNIYNPFTLMTVDLQELFEYLDIDEVAIVTDTGIVPNYKNLAIQDILKNLFTYGFDVMKDIGLNPIICNEVSNGSSPHLKFVDVSTALNPIHTYLLPYVYGKDGYDFPFMRFDVHPNLYGHKMLAEIGYNAKKAKKLNCPPKYQIN